LEDNGLNIENWDTPIYRVYSRKWFEDLLNKKNGLVHPSLWDDPLENFFLQCEVRDESDNSLGSLHEISKNWYGQCWTKNRDSDAIWRIYNEQKNGVLVVTTIKKLFENFYDRSDPSAYLKYFIGEVQYQERIEIETFLAKTSFTDLALGGQSKPFAHTLCIKRKAFNHENEVRLLFHDTDETKGINNVASFHFDLNAILSEVVLDPRLLPHEYEAAEQEIRNLGCTLKISQSDLYKINPVIIRL